MINATYIITLQLKIKESQSYLLYKRMLELAAQYFEKRYPISLNSLKLKHNIIMVDLIVFNQSEDLINKNWADDIESWIEKQLNPVLY